MAKPIRLPNAQEQAVLDQLVVRLIKPEERSRWNELVSTHHYLKNATLVGEHLCYAAEYQGTWLALLGWAAPARHLLPRDAWVGWSKEQLPCRRHFFANNTRLCIVADPHLFPNLASRASGLNCARIGRDWLTDWGHPLVALESFVDGQLFGGTAYKAAGWKRLDDTSGYARVAEDFYVLHERPKQLCVRALDEAAFRSLRAQTLPPALAIFEKPPPPERQRCPVPTRRLAALADKLPINQPDPRSARGRWHSWPAVLNLICLAKLCGVATGQRQIAEFARGLTQPQRRALDCRRDPDNPRHYVAPSESTFQRALVEIDHTSLEPLLLQ